MRLWEILEETTEADEAEVLIAEVLETEAGLTEAEVLIAEIEATDKCLKQLVPTAEENVKFLLDPQATSPFIVATVLKKWAMADATTEDLLTDPDLRTEMTKADKVVPNWTQSLPNWTEF